MTHRNPDTPAPEIVPTHPIAAVMALIAGLKPRARLLGLDVGSTTIGLAISDFSRTIASPLETITRGKLSKDLEALRGIIAGREVGALVIGLPINMDGSEGPRCQSVRQFAENFLAVQDIDIVFWDERLSTAAVERELIGTDMSRARRAEVIDEH
ncbi:MAG: Holliday junction resolvase RuvX, partial [Alphaproteobacteria bacterium]|nr:Holliday junction resolvase RuvX [Alphaproteobacteria bacterium]